MLRFLLNVYVVALGLIYAVADGSSWQHELGVCALAFDSQWNPNKVVFNSYNSSLPEGNPLPVHIYFDGPALRPVLTLLMGNKSNGAKLNLLTDSGSSLLAACPGTYSNEEYLWAPGYPGYQDTAFVYPYPNSRLQLIYAIVVSYGSGSHGCACLGSGMGKDGEESRKRKTLSEEWHG